MAHSGLRPITISNYRGADGPGEILLSLRLELSKGEHFKEYLEERMLGGKELTADCPS